MKCENNWPHGSLEPECDPEAVWGEIGGKMVRVWLRRVVGVCGKRRGNDERNAIG